MLPLSVECVGQLLLQLLHNKRKLCVVGLQLCVELLLLLQAAAPIVLSRLQSQLVLQPLPLKCCVGLALHSLSGCCRGSLLTGQA